MNNNHIPIFFACDDNYVPLLSVSLCSILYNTNSFISFYILDDNIADFHKRQIIKSLKEKFSNFTIEFISLDLKKHFKNLSITPSYPTLSMYSRFLVPDLKKDINKAIYLDCDTIVLGDIAELYNENLDNYIIGAVPEHPFHDSVKKLKVNTNNSQNHLYFNSGVLLIDCKKWRKENILEKLLKISLPKLLCPDQDLLNNYFNENYKILSFKYNLKSADIFQNKCFQDSNNSEFIIEDIEKYKNKPLIKHFNSPDRVWQANKGFNSEKVKFFEDFWFFAKMTPFYEGMLNNFISNITIPDIKINNVAIEKNISNYIKRIKLFNIIPIIKLKKKNNKIKVYLFNFIPILIIKERVK